MKTQPRDSTHALLFLGKLSRDHLGYSLSRDQTSIKWSTLANLELAFFLKYPDHRKSYDEFMVTESIKWKGIFGQQFKIDSFSKFVFANKDDFDFIY